MAAPSAYRRRRRSLAFGAAAIAVVWAVTFAGMRLARASAVTAEKVHAYLQNNPLDDTLTPPQRLQVIDGLADRLNRLTYDERQRLHQDRALESLRDRLTEDEQLHLLDRTLPQGMKQMMEAFNEMPRDRRQQMVQEAMTNLDRARHDVQAPARRRLDDQATQRIIEEGLRSYFSHASATAKLDLQPLIEQIQKQLQQPHSRHPSRRKQP